MKVSYNWLQSYFEKKLPEPEKLAEIVTFSFSEVEGIEKIGNDTVLDLKILPDRACYALSHRGVAREVAAMLGIPLKEVKSAPVQESAIPDPDVRVEKGELCTKFVSRSIQNIKVGESPQWLKERLEAIGQRSINNIVDATNFVMFDIGRPLHAFDADKVKGTLAVRSAKKGETVVTLDNKNIVLNHEELVVADDEGPMGLAGIKGGKRTEVDGSTKHLILEAANWNPVYIRRTSISTGIRTEASKRFENKLSPVLAEEGIEQVTRLILELASTKETNVGRQVVSSFEKVEEKTIIMDAESVSKRLGVRVSSKEIIEILGRLGIPCEEKGKALVASIPLERLDLTILEDLAEEVGRIMGYDKVPPVLPPKVEGKVAIPKQFYWEWKIRELLVNEGFSEVMTSSFSNKGEVAIEKPLAEDKRFARANLRDSFTKVLKMNYLNAPLFGTDEIKIFEIGKVFRKEKESTALAIGYASPKGKGKNMVEGVVKNLESELGVMLEGEMKGGVFECNLDAVIEKLPEPKAWDLKLKAQSSKLFTPFSAYPFIVRDVALFVPAGTKPEKVLACICKEAGKLAVRSWKFDEFEKGGKQSFAFRIVFQSFEKTLTDVEANAAMEKIYSALKKDFNAEIR